MLRCHFVTNHAVVVTVVFAMLLNAEGNGGCGGVHDEAHGVEGTGSYQCQYVQRARVIISAF